MGRPLVWGRGAGRAPRILAALTVAMACKGSKESAGGGTADSPYNSCAAVSQAQAADAIDESVTPGILGNAVVEGGVACVFYGPSAPSPHDPNTPQSDTVRVVVVKGPNAATWYEDYRSKIRAQPIPGFGDQAYFDGYASLSIMKGSAYVRIAVVPNGGPPSLAREKKLASSILPGL